MYKHILLPTDGSDLSKAAIKHGLALAKTLGAKVTALVVSAPPPPLVVDLESMAGAVAQYKVLVTSQTAKYLESVRREAENAGVECTALRVEHDKPYEAIVDTANAKGCDLVVMASHGLRGVSAILGSETLKVLTNSSVPILVYR
jgi:nucleotide-binding universal stress UspA family protein